MELATRRPPPNAAGYRVPGTRPQRDAAVRLLVAASAEGGVPAEDPVRQLEEASIPVLGALVRYHGVAGLLYEHLRGVDGVPTSLMSGLTQAYTAATRRHMLTSAELIKVAAAFEASSVPWAVVKGPALVETAYDGRPGRRGYSDLDVVVHPAAFRKAVDALREMGAELFDRNWRMLRRDLRGEVLFGLPAGTPLDLHWNLINMYRRRMRVDTAEIIGRARRMEIGTVSVPVLDPEDGVIHLALHGALSGGDRLLWLKDIERASAVWRPDWDVVAERARRWNVAPAVGLMLGRSRSVLDADIPASVPPRLIGATSARIGRWVEKLSPWPYGMGRTGAPTRLFARSIGHGLAGGLAWIAWRSVRNLDPRQERLSSAFRARGTDEDWQAFVDAVVGTARQRNQ